MIRTGCESPLFFKDFRKDRSRSDSIPQICCVCKDFLKYDRNTILPSPAACHKHYHGPHQGFMPGPHYTELTGDSSGALHRGTSQHLTVPQSLSHTA